MLVAHVLKMDMLSLLASCVPSQSRETCMPVAGRGWGFNIFSLLLSVFLVVFFVVDDMF